MLGVDSSFSIWIRRACETENSSLPSASAIFRLSSATSRVVRPRRERSCFSRSPARIATPIPPRISTPLFLAESYIIVRGLRRAIFLSGCSLVLGEADSDTEQEYGIARVVPGLALVLRDMAGAFAPVVRQRFYDVHMPAAVGATPIND